MGDFLQVEKKHFQVIWSFRIFQYSGNFAILYHLHTGKKNILQNLYAILGHKCPRLSYKFIKMSFLRCISLI